MSFISCVILIQYILLLGNFIKYLCLVIRLLDKIHKFSKLYGVVQ